MDPIPDTATVKFAQALPFVLLPASSHLAARHAARARPSVPSVCPRCGADATFQHTRIARRSKQARLILTTCAACDGVVSTPFQSDAIPLFSTRKRKPMAPSPQLLVKASPLPVSDQLNVTPKAVAPVAAARENGPPPNTLGSSSGKNKKKSGLQQMLERNREKERHKAKAADAKQSSGLSAFLSTL